jgi:hypothetical protein
VIQYPVAGQKTGQKDQRKQNGQKRGQGPEKTRKVLPDRAGAQGQKIKDASRYQQMDQEGMDCDNDHPVHHPFRKKSSIF